jgi:multisubunit Na+/H+ antiporter MnhB subunit
MFILISLFIIFYIFSSSAKRAHKAPFPWLILGFVIWLGLGGLFLLITNTFILHTDSLTDAIPLEKWELVLQGISAAIITIVAYIIQKKFIRR